MSFVTASTKLTLLLGDMPIYVKSSEVSDGARLLSCAAVSPQQLPMETCCKNAQFMFVASEGKPRLRSRKLNVVLIVGCCCHCRC